MNEAAPRRLGRPAGPGWRKRPGAPASGTVLCAEGEIAEGTAKVFEFGSGAERFEMFALRHHGRVVAYVNECPHAALPLDWNPGHFLDLSRTQILCANHGALFRIADGFCVHGPCEGRSLVAVPIDVVDGAICVGGD